LRCVCDVFAMCLRCVCDVFAMCLRCVCDVFAMCLRCVCVVFALCLRCVCVVFALCLRCVCDVFVGVGLRPTPTRYPAHNTTNAILFTPSPRTNFRVIAFAAVINDVYIYKYLV